MSVTTTKNGFPVVDVTHKPKRMQSANLRAVQTSEDINNPAEVQNSEVPKVITLERAIHYYESHATGELAVLYSRTAQWLRELMSKNIPVEPEDVAKALELLDSVGGK